MATTRRDFDLRRALEALTSDGSLSGTVRLDIGASWERSLSSGLAPGQLEVPHGEDLELDDDSALVRAARPVFRSLGDELASARIGIVLADEHGQVVERHVTERALIAGLDGILLAPGFVYSEPGVGTNGIGTALEEGAPAFVEGAEHFADDLTGWACAGAPVVEPGSGRVLGIVDLTCRDRDASPLMLPLARRAAAEIEQQLLDEAGVIERAARQWFLGERGQTTSAIILVYQGKMMTNAAADELISPEDQRVLWPIAAQALERRCPQRMSATLSNGRPVVLRSEPVVDGEILTGALVRVDARSHGQVRGRTRRPSHAPMFGWESLTDTEKSVVSLASRGMTNRQIGAELFVSHRTVSAHLYRIFPKLGVTSRVELTRLVLERGLLEGE